MPLRKTRDSFMEVARTTLWVWKLYMRISPGFTILHILLQIVLSFQSLANALFLGFAIDLAVEITRRNIFSVQDFFPLIFAFVGVRIVFDLLSLLVWHTGRMLESQDHLKLRAYLYEQLNSLGVAQLENPEVSNRSQRYLEAIGTMTQHLGMMVSLIGQGMTIIGASVILLRELPFIIPFYLLVFFIKLRVNRHFLGKIWHLNIHNTEYRRKSFTTANMLSDSVVLKELKITNGFDYLKHKFEAYIAWNFYENRKIRDRWTIARVMQYVMDNLGFGVGLYSLLERLTRSLLSIGSLTFHLRTLSIFAETLENVTFRIVNLRESAIKLADVQELFTKFQPDEDGKLLVSEDPSPPQIEIKNISFKYPNSKSNVLVDINLSIKPGEKIAIVGENGAGKTTLVKLLGRFYRPQNGEISINSQNLNDLTIASWHRKIGILFQDYNQYSHLTAKENIGIGDIHKQFDAKEIKSAIKQANAEDFIKKFPQGLEQTLSEKYTDGIRPSTGQWQKIAIARFFYRDAPVLIFDEPTASIDAVSEAEIFDNIYKFIKNKTVIIISHRFSTVRNADRILVLDNGKIVEEGSHKQLLKKKGKYAKAFNLQAKGYE